MHNGMHRKTPCAPPPSQAIRPAAHPLPWRERSPKTHPGRVRSPSTARPPPSWYPPGVHSAAQPAPHTRPPGPRSRGAAAARCRPTATRPASTQTSLTGPTSPAAGWPWTHWRGPRCRFLNVRHGAKRPSANRAGGVRDPIQARAATCTFLPTPAAEQLDPNVCAAPSSRTRPSPALSGPSFRASHPRSAPST